MRIRHKFQLFALLGCLLAQSARSQDMAPATTNPPPSFSFTGPESERIVLPEGFRDPLESFNRSIWGFNEWFLTDVVKPAGRGYRCVIPSHVRLGIKSGGKNITYPGRLINNLLQGKWHGARDETYRFLCNSTFGIGGLFDVATKWNIPKSDENFGRTFQKWGYQPGCFLMLPIFGPNDERDTTGLIADYAANPCTYFFPYCWIGSGVMANNLMGSAEGTACAVEAQSDPYSLIQYAWSFGHVNRQPDLTLSGSQDEASLETLHAFFFGYTNPEFPAWAKTRSVLIPSTGKKLQFTYWLHKGNAPVVYLVPGFGAHRLAGNELGLAELLYTNGYTPVCISSSFHPEFMQEASTSDLPAYPPGGVQDVHVALTEIDHLLNAKYPHRLGSRAIMGYSMGGFQTLFLAAQEATNQSPLLKFDRYVAIDAPVRLRYCATNLDDLYKAALEWPAAERTERIENTLQKVLALSDYATPQTPLPLNGIESRFLIGLSFHFSMRDIIFDSQLRHNKGVLQQPLNKKKRKAAYDEILQYSFLDYINRFAIPYDKANGIDMKDSTTVKNATELVPYTDELKGNSDIRVIANRNDLFLQDQDVAWIQSTFAPSQVRLFDHGGHLGNLCQPEVQQAVLAALDGLGNVPKK